MQKSLKVLTHSELVELSDVELIKRVWLALGQLDEADERSESKTNNAGIYRVYENELARRHYAQRSHSRTNLKSH